MKLPTIRRLSRAKRHDYEVSSAYALHALACARRYATGPFNNREHATTEAFAAAQYRRQARMYAAGCRAILAGAGE